MTPVRSGSLPIAPAQQLDFFSQPQCPVYLDGYDRVVIAMSGGKDSIGCFLEYLEQGGDIRKVEFWHHRIDGENGDFMDWPCTNAYVAALAAAFKVPLYFTWKVDGFEGEMMRENALTKPICFQEPVGDPRFGGPVRLRQTGGTGGKLSTRLAFPQVAADLSVRWCSSYLKIDNARTALRNQERFRNTRTLFISGERAEESPGRAGYARFEVDDSDARHNKRLRRHIDRWRPLHHWSEQEVWAIMKRWGINPHPAYRLGWSRCSCAGCIFNGCDEFATLRLINPAQFNRIAEREKDFNRTIKRKIALNALADLGTPFPVKDKDVRAALSTEWTEDMILDLDAWELPSGAFSKGNGPS